jgi:hypothetical protein
LLHIGQVNGRVVGDSEIEPSFGPNFPTDGLPVIRSGSKAIGIYNRSRLFLGLGWSFFDFAILPSVLLVRIVSALDQQHHQDREIFQQKATHEVDQIPPTRTEAEELRWMILLS